MFITKTINESADMNVEQFDLIDSICESYEDLLNFNEALAHFDIKEQELIHTESAELDVFREDAMDKAKTFLKDLAEKIKVKWNQFINFVLKKLVTMNKAIADKVNASLKGVNKSSLEKVIDEKGVKVKFFSKSNSLYECLSDIIDYMIAAFKEIETGDDLANFKPAELFKELVGETKEARPVSGKDVTGTLDALNTTDRFIKTTKSVSDIVTHNASNAASGDEKEVARHLTLINLKCQQVTRLGLSAVVTLGNLCAGILIRAAYAYHKEVSKNKSDEK